jgi:hypothetical protein
MSDPPPGAQKAPIYTIDPDKQCGVVKLNGDRCATRLNCSIHKEVEKLAVCRSNPYQTLLTAQNGPLAPRPPAHHAHLTRLASVFDPDWDCGVSLLTGNPCTQDLLLCKTHHIKQQSRVQRRSVQVEALLEVIRANELDYRQYHPDTKCGVLKANGEPCQTSLSCIYHDVQAKRAVPRNRPDLFTFDALWRIQESRDILSGPHEPWRIQTPRKYQEDYQGDLLFGSGEGQQASAGEGGTGNDKTNVQGHSHGSPPATPSRPSRGPVDTASPNHASTAPSPKTPRGNVSPLLLNTNDTSDGDLFTPTSSRGGTGDDKMHVQGGIDDASPVTPVRPPRGDLDTASPSNTHTALSPKTPRGNMSPLSLDTSYTSDGEQFTPTSSRVSLHGHVSGGKYEDTVEGSKADLDAQEARLERGWAQLHQDQARQELDRAKLDDDRYRLETQLLQDQAREDREKAQLYYLDKEYRRGVQLQYEQDRAKLDRRVHEQQVSEDEVARLRKRAQRADELEKGLNIQRSQKAIMSQALRSLRAGLERQETSYQNELMSNASQTDTLGVQMRELQQSMEVLMIEKTNATARHQQHRAGKEAEINHLQERINALSA